MCSISVPKMFGSPTPQIHPWPRPPGDLDETKTEKASDEKYAKDLKATCSKKAAAFDERQKLRKEDGSRDKGRDGVLSDDMGGRKRMKQ
jgi:hypothetical protein